MLISSINVGSNIQGYLHVAQRRNWEKM